MNSERLLHTRTCTRPVMRVTVKRFNLLLRNDTYVRWSVLAQPQKQNVKTSDVEFNKRIHGTYSDDDDDVQ